jgi:hypothetical protein
MKKKTVKRIWLILVMLVALSMVLMMAVPFSRF